MNSLPPEGSDIGNYGISSGYPFLPVRYSTDLTDVLLRDLKPQEISKVYSMFSWAAQAGYGYSVSEVGDFDEFTKILRDKVTIVMADPATDAIIYVMIVVTDDKFLRHSGRAMHARGWGVVNPENKPGTRDPDLFKVLYQTTAWLGHHLGFRYSLATTTQNNHVVRCLNDNTIKGTIVGMLPDGIYLQSRGWTDMVIYQGLLADNFTESDFKH